MRMSKGLQCVTPLAPTWPEKHGRALLAMLISFQPLCFTMMKYTLMVRKDGACKDRDVQKEGVWQREEKRQRQTEKTVYLFTSTSIFSLLWIKLVNSHWTWHQWFEGLSLGEWCRNGGMRWERLSCVDGRMVAWLGEGWKRKLKRRMDMSEGTDKHRKGRTKIKLSGRCVKDKRLNDIQGSGRRQHVPWMRIDFVYTAICYHGTNHILSYPAIMRNVVFRVRYVILSINLMY